MPKPAPNRSFKLRGMTAEQIKWLTESRKRTFISLYCEPDETMTSAATKVGTNLKQIRRWREADPEFDARVSDMERIAVGIEDQIDFDDTVRRCISYIKAFVKKWNEEVGYPMFRKGAVVPPGAPPPPKFD